LTQRFRSRELDVNILAQAVRALFEFEELNGNFWFWSLRGFKVNESYN